MTGPATSVVVVSRGRPDHLARCLTGLAQLWYDNFEIVVVADPEGCSAAAPWSTRIKLVPFDEANVSAARNAGIAAASGEIIAFIDDDAVPEPTWLTRLVEPFADPEVAQTGGFVRGRNGITFQWQARVVNRLGEARAINAPEETPFEPEKAPDEATKTEGTNMALRRSVLEEVGGFDPGFRFYLDETDLNMRLSDRRTVIVPLAEVHHGFAASSRRGPDRAVLDLSDIGASSALFLRKHARAEDVELGRNRAYSEQKARLARQSEIGLISAADIPRLLETFDAGFARGLSDDVVTLAPLAPPSELFLRFIPDSDGEAVVLAGRLWSRRRLLEQARALRKNGKVVTVICLSHTPRRHRVRFRPDGIWEQRGGLFGPSDRDQPVFRFSTFAGRVRKETLRFARLRNK